MAHRLAAMRLVSSCLLPPLAAPLPHPLSTLASNSTASSIPVLIAGAGPTGLTLSLLLSRFQIPHLVIDRAASLTNHPQAHYINNRTMEIFRSLDGLASEVSASSPPLETWRRFIYCRSMLGNLLGSVDHFATKEHGTRMDACDPRISPEGVTHLSQHRLAAILFRRARDSYASIPSSSSSSSSHILFQHSLEAIEHNDTNSGVRVKIRDESGSTRLVQAQYLVGADGAHSTVRQCLQMDLAGQPALQHLINVHFSSPALGQRLLAMQRPGMLYFCFHPRVIAVIVAHDLARGDFVAQLPFFPPIDRREDFTREHCSVLLQHAIGNDAVEHTIHSIRPWVMSAQVAEQYQRGNVLLAGDAAHCFPPAGGFGMNTGIQDAHNLAWKLALAIKNRNGEVDASCTSRLLASYESERRPIALANTALSLANWHDSLRIPRALGLDPRAASLLTSTAEASLALSILPTEAVRRLGKGVIQLGQRLASQEGPLSTWRQEAVRDILDRGESLRLQYPREDLGFQYNAAMNTNTTTASPPSSRSEPFVPKLLVGARFPHLFITRCPDHHDEAGGGDGRLSTIDLASPPTSSLARDAPDPALVLVLPLLLDPSTAKSRLMGAVQQLGQLRRLAPHIPLRLVALLDAAPHDELDHLVFEMKSYLETFRLAPPSTRDDFAALLSPPRPDASLSFILVRPDGHVASLGWNPDALDPYGSDVVDAIQQAAHVV